MDELSQLGALGIFAFLVIKELLNVIKERNAGKRKTSAPPPPKCPIPMETIEQIGETHRILSRTDSMGAPLLYQLLRRQTELLEKLAEDVRIQRQLLINQGDAISAIARNANTQRPNGAQVSDSGEY